MTESKTKKSIRNIIWASASRVLSIVLPFFSRTIIIQSLGAGYVGLGSLFTSLISVLSLAELGISEAIIFSLYKPIAENDSKKVCALLNFYRKAYRYIGGLILVIGLLLMVRIEVFINGEYPNEINLRILFLIYLLNTVSSYFSYSYLAVILTATQRNDIDYKISCVINIIRDSAQIAILLLFKDYYIYALVLPIATIAHNVIRSISIKKNFPTYTCRGQLDKETKQIIKKQVGGLLLGKFCVTSRNSFDSIILSAILGLVAVACYSNYYYVMNTVYSFLLIFSVAIRGGIGNNVATKKTMENYDDMLNISELFWWLYSVCTAILVCLYQPFMLMWAGEDLLCGFGFAILFAVYFYLLCNYVVFSQYIEANGLYWENRIRFILESVSNLCLNIILVKIMGIYGIVLATVLTTFFLTNIYGCVLGFKYYFVGCDRKKYITRQVFNFFITVVGAALSCLICHNIDLSGWLGLFVRALITLIVCLLVFFVAKCRTIEFKQLKEYLLLRLAHR